MILTRDKIIDAGVRNLKEFGYPNVNKDNILTDFIFKSFFQKMLEEAIQKDSNQSNAITLLQELKK